KKEMILLEDKKEIIRKHEGGMRLTDLAKEDGRSASTIGTILKMKEKIRYSQQSHQDLQATATCSGGGRK
ncbi:tigger transposable element-derived 1-like, partial [Pelobates cultripes]